MKLGINIVLWIPGKNQTLIAGWNIFKVCTEIHILFHETNLYMFALQIEIIFSDPGMYRFDQKLKLLDKKRFPWKNMPYR